MPEFSEVAGTVIRRDRSGYQLLTWYYVLATAVVVVGCAIQPAAAGIFTGAAIPVGIILLTYVSIANRRGLRPLAEHWPTLAKAPARRGAPTRPHGVTGVFYVFGLLLIAAAGGLTTSLVNASAASATTQVTVLSCDGTSRVETCTATWHAGARTYRGTINWASEPGTEQGRYNPKAPDTVYSGSSPYLNGGTVILGTFIIVMGSVCGFICLLYQRQTRRPYLAALERALSSGTAPVPEDVPFSWFPRSVS